MINLFENYTEPEQDLEHSLHEAGYDAMTVVLNDNGFLPQEVVSPIGFFTQMDMYKREAKTQPKFFNELSLPNYWEIQASGNEGNIYEGYKRKGHINYSRRSGDFRMIQSVEWFNEAEGLRAIDLYNQNGFLFGRETFSDGGHVLTSYFDSTGREILLMNQVLGTVQLVFEGKTHVFSDYMSFILFYFKAAQLPVQRIFYNHLGRPFFITNALQAENPDENYDHLLFWQEQSEEMPGNMKGIFEAEFTTTHHIVVQDRAEYERLRPQIPAASQVKMSYLGYLYNFKREASKEPNVLIHTNSDQLELIQELVQSLPEFHFHISARTEMSEKLMNLEEYSNVSLYPNISTSELQALLSESSFYLDINYGDELDNIVRQAFDHNLLLFAFDSSLHNSRLISPTHVFSNKKSHLLIQELKGVCVDSTYYMEALSVQLRDAGQVSIEAYKEIL